jgi:hypothetical protein
MTELAALNVKINGDSADLQSDLAKAKTQLAGFEAQANKANRGAAGFSGGLARLGNVSGSTRAKIQNTSFQLQDIAVQLQSGTRASTVFAQQLPQLLGGFGAVGAVAGVLAGVGIPALAFAFAAAGDEAKSLDDALDEMISSFERLAEIQSLAGASNTEIAKQFGGVSDEIRDLIRSQIELAERNAVADFENISIVLKSIQGDLGDAVAAFDRFGQTAGTRFEGAKAAVSGFDPIVQLAAKAISDLGDGSERTFEEMADATANARRALEALNDPTYDAQISQLNRIETALRKITAEADIAYGALSDLSGEFQAAAARRGVEAGAIPPEALADLPMTPGQEALEKVFSRRRTERDRAARTSGTRGGARTNPLIAQLESVQVALMTQEEAQIASFERQQETLQQALEQRLLTQQEYNALMEEAQSRHSDRMTQIDVYRYGTGLDKAGQFLGDMASAFQGGNEKMLRIAKVFGAAQALISAWQGAAEALKLPFPQNLAAFAKVLATGLGAVQAIKGVTAGSGATGGAAGAIGGTAAAAAPAAPSVSRNVAISLTGGDIFSRDQVINLINRINEAVEDGAVVRLV